MNVFFMILGSVFAIDLFVWWQGARRLRKSRLALRLAFHGFLAFQVAALTAIIVSRMKGWDLDSITPTYLYSIVFIWHLLTLPVALFLNLFQLIGEGIGALVRYFRKPEPLPGPAMNRREFLGTAVALAPPFLTLALGGVASEQLSHFRIRRMTVSLPQLPPALDGMTIAHLSDIHVGRFSNGSVLKKMADETNALNADLVVCTGDILNDSIQWLPNAIEMMQQIKKPVYVCEGNHDLIDNPEEFYRQMKAASGVSLLLNEAETVSVRDASVQLLGICWSGRRRKGRIDQPQQTAESNMADLLRQRDPSAFPILLAHHPHVWDASSDIPLTLAGHTHGGQLMVNDSLGAGPMMFQYWSGLYTRENSALVVSNGTGNWFPLRVGAPAEIIHITLKRGG